MFCSNCGSKQPEDMIFCGDCGTKVETMQDKQPLAENDKIATPEKEKDEKESESQPKPKKPNKRLRAVIVILLLGIAIVLIARACNSSSPARLIVGEWRNTYWGETWIFESNGRVRLREDGETASGTFNISRDNTLTVTFVFSWGNDEMTFNWVDNEETQFRDDWWVTQDSLFIDGLVFVRRQN